MTDARRPVVYGGSGFTGRLVARAMAEAGMDFVLAGRSRARLEAAAADLQPRPELRVADAADPASLRALAAEASIVCSTVGPFARLGRPVVDACLEEGAHYLDTTGEQGWMAEVYDACDARAQEAGVVLCPSLAFEVAVADSAAALAAAGLEAVEKVAIVYVLQGFGTSQGTRASAVGQLRHGGWQHVGGARRPMRVAEALANVHLPGDGDRKVAAFPSGEVLTVPRHLPVSEVRTWAAVPASLARLLHHLAPALQGLARTGAGARLERLLARTGGAPDDADRAASEVLVLATAHGREGGRAHARTVLCRMRDPYGLTAKIVVAGAQAILSGSAAPGARAPAEVVGDPAAFLASVGVEVTQQAGDVGV